MKKHIIILIFAISGVMAQAQMKVAVLDFKAGAGVEQGDVDGISAIFGTYFIDPSSFVLVERTQIDRVISEQGFQYSTMTNQQMVMIGQILNIQKLVVGDVNIVSGQYNVDVRVVNVETGAISATDGATWARGSSYRDLMKNLANSLMTKMLQQQTGTGQNQTTVQNSVVILYNYLKVYPEDLGAFASYPDNIVAAINKDISYGYDTWRLPTEEEMSLLNSNRGKVQGLSSSDPYMIIEGSNAGRIRLVTNRETVEERNKILQEYDKQFPIKDIYANKKLVNYSDSAAVFLKYYMDLLSVHPKISAGGWVQSANLIPHIKGLENIINTQIKYLENALEIQPDYIDAFRSLVWVCLSTLVTDTREMGKNYAIRGARFGCKDCVEMYNKFSSDEDKIRE